MCLAEKGLVKRALIRKNFHIAQSMFVSRAFCRIKKAKRKKKKSGSWPNVTPLDCVDSFAYHEYNSCNIELFVELRKVLDTCARFLVMVLYFLLRNSHLSVPRDIDSWFSAVILKDKSDIDILFNNNDHVFTVRTLFSCNLSTDLTCQALKETRVDRTIQFYQTA